MGHTIWKNDPLVKEAGRYIKQVKVWIMPSEHEFNGEALAAFNKWVEEVEKPALAKAKAAADAKYQAHVEWNTQYTAGRRPKRSYRPSDRMRKSVFGLHHSASSSLRKQMGDAITTRPRSNALKLDRNASRLGKNKI